MNKSFILLKNDKTQVNANIIVKFTFENREYLVYSVDENEKNAQIFVSKLILNSEGKYFIENIMPEEKNKLNNIVYNIVILIPTEAQKGVSFEILSKNLFDKYSIQFSLDIPDLAIQEYFSNCSFAVTSKILVNNSITFYLNNLKKEEIVSVPVWSSPVDQIIPVSNTVNALDNNTSIVSSSNIPIGEVVSSNLNLASSSIDKPVISNEGTSIPEISNTIPVVAAQEQIVNEIKSNPQVEKLAVVSDPSLGIGVTQPNIGKTKKAGFANTKYIVIGTICLVLAVAVVITAYILIKNMQ